MPSLRDKAHDGVLCTFSSRISATAAGLARSSQLSSSRPGQAVRSVREGGMDRPSQHSLTQLIHSPWWVISLVFGLIDYARKAGKTEYSFLPTLHHGIAELFKLALY
jgi:hypothetical protein